MTDASDFPIGRRVRVRAGGDPVPGTLLNRGVVIGTANAQEWARDQPDAVPDSVWDVPPDTYWPLVRLDARADLPEQYRDILANPLNLLPDDSVN
jgi:hypothetical protein